MIARLSLTSLALFFCAAHAAIAGPATGPQVPASSQVIGVPTSKSESAEAIDQTDLAKIIAVAKRVVLEGPFEYQDGTGTLGFIVMHYEKTMVGFQPCKGDIVKVDRTRLKESKNGCDREPNPGPRSAQLNCDQYQTIASVLDKYPTVPAGTVYAASNTDDPLIGMVTAENAWKAWNSVSLPGSPCGSGEAIVFTTDRKETYIGVIRKAFEQK